MFPKSISYRTLIQVNLFVKVMVRLYSARFFLVVVLILANSLLLTPAGSMLRVVGVVLLFLLPGLIWAERWLSLIPPLPRWMIGAGLSYSMVIMAGLLLHYLPGPIPLWAELITLDVLALIPLLWSSAPLQLQPHFFSRRLSMVSWLLLAILFLAAFFRFADLGYSEFHEDELEAMHPAAEALVGHEDALFVNRRKGPGEVLLPMMMWGLLGVINELSARLPFAIAGLLLVPTIYVLGDRLLANKWVGLVAASLIALNRELLFNTEAVAKNRMFGLVHQRGWKVIGALYAHNQLSGDYSSNEKPQVTRWYIRDRLPACGPQIKYYLATTDGQFNFWSLNSGLLNTYFDPVGQVTLPNSQGVAVYQVRPATETLGQIDPMLLVEAFDRTATPAAFAYGQRQSRSLDVTLAESIRLVGYDLNVLRVRPGGQIEVTLYWQPHKRLNTDYNVFVHIEGDGTTNSPAGVWGQSDGRPACQFYPTSVWQPDELIPDPHVFQFNPDTPPGEYAVLVGLYRPDNGVRLEVLDEAGQPVANFVKLTSVTLP